nr:uncharacterized protein LOC109746936 [Aegilops tauschii subsp. strangulata]
MDSYYEEAFPTLLEEEADADAQDEEHIMVLAALGGLFASNAKPRRGGSAVGWLNAKLLGPPTPPSLASPGRVDPAPSSLRSLLTTTATSATTCSAPQLRDGYLFHDQLRTKATAAPRRRCCVPLPSTSPEHCSHQPPSPARNSAVSEPQRSCTRILAITPGAFLPRFNLFGMKIPKGPCC